MKLSEIVIRLRDSNTRFGSMIAGAAEMNIAMTNTLANDMAFVVPVQETTSENKYDNHIEQLLKERFSVVCVIKNDYSTIEKTGVIAFDKLHEVRKEIFKAILGWEPSWAQNFIYYLGGGILNVNNAYLWYQFNFEVESLIQNIGTVDNPVIGVPENTIDYDQVAYDWHTIYANFILSPSERLPIDEIPLNDGYPDVTINTGNMAQRIDMTNHPDNGAFWRSFSSEFNKYGG